MAAPMHIRLIPSDPAQSATSGRLSGPFGSLACVIGRGGVRRDKREGDGATPAGRFALRRVLYRPDRGAAPQSALPVEPLAADMGWCDDPSSPAYNRQVVLPFEAGAERLWRDDHLYDLIVVIGHNDDPVVAGAGSAIFIHVAAPDLSPTEGCIALSRPDLETLISCAAPGDTIEIAGGPG